MTATGRRPGLAGTLGAYDTCPGCGHARVKHLSKHRGGCTAFTWPNNSSKGDGVCSPPGLCPCPLDNEFSQPMEAM